MGSSHADDPRRRRQALLLLVPIFVVSVAGALWVPFHSASSIDSRTHIEMMKGITQHGLPYAYNGPTGLYPELQMGWNIVHDGKLWGNYPPVFAYASVPFFLAGGLRAVSALSMLLMSLLALGVYKLGARYTRDPIAGAAAAYVAVFSTPAGVSSLDIGPFMLCITLLTWGVYFALDALEESGARARRSAILAGLVSALACATHLVTFPMLVGMIAVLGMAPVDGEAPIVPWPALARVTPTRSSVRRAALAGAGAMVPLLGLAVLNKLRFGSLNPLSYGPCVWRRCEDTGLKHQSAGAMLAYTAPVLAVVAVTAVVAYVVRKERYKLVLATLAGVALLFYGPPVVRDHAAGLWTIGRGYFLDVTGITMPPMINAADGLGVFWGPYVVKSTLQSSPIFGAALLAPFATARDRRATLLLALPCAGLYALLSMRAVIPAVHALGFPWLYLRYAMPAWPLLAVLAVGALKDLAWTRERMIALVLLGGALAALFAIQGDDRDFYRRALILRGSLVLVALGAFLPWLPKAWVPSLDRARLEVASVAFVLGVTFTCGIDVNATVGVRSHNDERVDAIARLTPERVALVGYAGELDVPLTLRATRDVEYADLVETPDWDNFRALIDYWSDRKRPIFALWPTGGEGIKSRWPDVEFQMVDPSEQLYRVVRK